MTTEEQARALVLEVDRTYSYAQIPDLLRPILEKVIATALAQARREALEENDRRTFWVVEQFTNEQSQGYWDGGHSRSFTRNIDDAIQFCRHCDALWATRGWHWNDTKITEHILIRVAGAPAGQ